MNRLSVLHRLAMSAAAFAPLLSASPADAQGDLLVAPTRVVMNNGGNAEVVLSNIGERPATYRITLELRRMDEDGDFKDIAETDANTTERSALDMVRYAPRRVTLLPGQPQAVRLSVRPPEGLPDGEYRVHMGFRAIPTPGEPEPAETAAPATGVSIKLIPIYGITIPVFVRKGQLEGKAAIAGAHVVSIANANYLEVDLGRTGTRSVYGELIGKSARGEVLFNMRGVAVYTEVNKRKVHVPLSAEQAAKVKGPVKIEYRELPENGGALITESTVTVS